MAEQISTIIDKSKLVGGEVINEQILESQEEEKNKEKETEVISETLIDKSKLIGGEKVEEPTQITFTTDSIIDKSKLVGGENAITGEAYTEPTNWDRLEYGWDKETMAFGNLFRIGKAYVQDVFDDDKTFKDYILENENKRIEDLYKEHWKFKGREDEGGLTTVGSIASMLLDPYYLAGYLNPISVRAMANPISSATLNGLLISGDVILDDLAKTGEVDWNKVKVSGATAAAIGAVIPIGSKIIKKYAPKMIESEVKLVAEFIDKKLARNNNLSTSQLKKIQAVSTSAEVKTANNELIKWTRNFVAPMAAETRKFKALEKTLLEKRNLLINIRKLKGKKKPVPGKLSGMLKQEPLSKQIVNIRNQIIDAKKASEAAKKILIDKQAKKLDKWSELVANRNTKILEQLRKNETRIDWAARGLLSATIRPLVGAGMGTVGGILFGDEETDLMYWATAGAVAGQMQKMIARSSKFGTQLEKGKILGVIDRELTQLALQKVRDLMSATSSSKLNSYGGATEKISKLLLREIDSPVQEKSAIAVAEQMQRYFFRKADNLTKGYTAAEQAEAISLLRGKQITKETPKRVEELSKNIKTYLDEFKDLYNSAGFFSQKEIDNYFPRVLNFDLIKRDEKAFLKTVEGIYKSLGHKNPEKAALNYYNGHKTSGDSVFNALVLKEMFAKSTSGVSKEGNKFIITPVSEHITKERALKGPYKLVEEVLEKKGYLVNDARFILSRIANDSVKSIAFARQFGTHGELLQPFFKQIRDKYLKSGLETDKALSAANQEMKLVANTIDAYFDRHGVAMTGASKSAAGIIATLGNANMLGRVTITSLGDLVQPFQNSSSFRAIVQGWRKTALRGKKESGLARNLNYDISNEIQQGLIKSAGMESKNVVMGNSFMGQTPNQKINNIMFKFLGLEWLTGYARRFAYNVGNADAFYLSKTLNQLTKKGLDNSGRAKRIKYFLENNYGINNRQALQIGAAKNFDDAILNNANKKVIEQAGVITSNRDALIPQVSNRLLFTQSNNQWVRLMGQFLSWAQAKSAQTNKILQRIENGSAKTLVKTLAVLPVYSGIQSLRELAKHGEVVTDYDANNNRWWAEGARLSGMFGFLPELVANRFIGPGAREPWYLFAPFFQIISAPGQAIKQAWDGNTDRAIRIINERLLPLPNWRRRLWDLFQIPKPLKLKGSGTIGGELMPFELGGLVLRKKFNQGDAVILAAKESIKNDNTLPHVEEKATIIVDEETKERIKKHEGKKNIPYQLEYTKADGTKVKEDFWTVGHGHVLDKKTKDVYSDEEIEKFFQQDVEIASKAVDKLVNKSKVNPKAYNILVEMAYQMGGTNLSNFKKTLKHINDGNYNLASKEMLDSEWANQTPKRAKELSTLMSGLFVDK